MQIFIKKFGLDGQEASSLLRFLSAWIQCLRHWNLKVLVTCKQDHDTAKVMFIPSVWIVVAFLLHSLVFILMAFPLCDQTASARGGTLGVPSSLSIRFDLLLIEASDGTDSYLGRAETSHTK